MDKIFYRNVRGYKYQLLEEYKYQTAIKIKDDIRANFLKLKRNGLLIIFKGYAWDGPSGPTIDTKNFLRGSLVHDVLYQLIRLKLLSPEFKDYADRNLVAMCRNDGMSRFRSWYIYWLLRLFSRSAIYKKNPNDTIKLQAP